MDPNMQDLSLTNRAKDAPGGGLLRLSKSSLSITYKVNEEGLLKYGAENCIMGPFNL